MHTSARPSSCEPEWPRETTRHRSPTRLLSHSPNKHAPLIPLYPPNKLRAVDGGLALLRVCKPATLGLQAASRRSGCWRYEICMEHICVDDEGDIMVGWATDTDEAWRAGVSNGQTPEFFKDGITPKIWVGAVLSRSELALKANGETVYMSCVVDVDAAKSNKPCCWFNIFIGDAAEHGHPSDVRLKSSYSFAATVPEEATTSSSGSSWQELKMPTIDNITSCALFPCIALSSRDYLTINFGTHEFETPEPEPEHFPNGPFEGVLKAGDPSPIKLRQLVCLGGRVLSLDLNERMPVEVEYAARRGLWEPLKLMLTHQHQLLDERFVNEVNAELDATGGATRVIDRIAEVDMLADRILCTTNTEGKTLLHLAIDAKCYKLVDRLFDWLPPRADEELTTLLETMAELNEEKILQAEMKMLRTQDLDGCNPMLLAIKNGQDKMANRILEKAVALDKMIKRGICRLESVNEMHPVAIPSGELKEPRSNGCTANVVHAISDAADLARTAAFDPAARLAAAATASAAATATTVVANVADALHLTDRSKKKQATIAPPSGTLTSAAPAISASASTTALHSTKSALVAKLDRTKDVHHGLTSQIATQKNEEGVRPLWVAIEFKSDLALKLIDVEDVDKNQHDGYGMLSSTRPVRCCRPHLRLPLCFSCHLSRHDSAHACPRNG